MESYTKIERIKKNSIERSVHKGDELFIQKWILGIALERQTIKKWHLFSFLAHSGLNRKQSKHAKEIKLTALLTN